MYQVPRILYALVTGLGKAGPQYLSALWARPLNAVYDPPGTKT